MILWRDFTNLFHNLLNIVILICQVFTSYIEVKEIVSKVTFNYNVTLLQGVWFK